MVSAPSSIFSAGDCIHTIQPNIGPNWLSFISVTMALASNRNPQCATTVHSQMWPTENGNDPGMYNQRFSQCVCSHGYIITKSPTLARSGLTANHPAARVCCLISGHTHNTHQDWGCRGVIPSVCFPPLFHCLSCLMSTPWLQMLGN